MPTRFSPLALFLGLVVVLVLGSAIVTMTDRSRTLSISSEPIAMHDLSVNYDASMPPPVEMPEPMSAAPPRMVDAPAGPDVSVAAAPGVAFNYRYAFRLPPRRIPEVQERHAQGCEQLGPNRCRISAMHYRVEEDGRVEAMLALKLEPGIARLFGKNGAEAVIQAEGTLIGSDIAGLDAGGAIQSASRNIGQLQDDLRRLERRLAERTTAEERASREREIQALRRSLRAAQAGLDEQQESLASTPLVFQYASSAMAAAETTPSLAKANDRAFGNFLSGMTILYIVFVTLLPWILLGGLLWWTARSIGRRLGGKAAGRVAAASPA